MGRAVKLNKWLGTKGPCLTRKAPGSFRVNTMGLSGGSTSELRRYAIYQQATRRLWVQYLSRVSKGPQPLPNPQKLHNVALWHLHRPQSYVIQKKLCYDNSREARHIIHKATWSLWEQDSHPHKYALLGALCGGR